MHERWSNCIIKLNVYHHYRHPVGRGLKTVIIRYVCENITVAYRKQPVWSNHADSSVPIRAGDKKHNDSVQTGRKQRLEAGVSVLYSKFKVEDWRERKMGIVVGSSHDLKTETAYIVDKIVSVSQSLLGEVFPPQPHPPLCASSC